MGQAPKKMSMKIIMMVGASLLFAREGGTAGDTPAAMKARVVDERYPDGYQKTWGQVEERPDGTKAREGEWTYWFPGGALKAQGQYRSGKLEGAVGTTGIPLNGRDGVWIFWYPNGQKRQEALYRDGKKNGPFRSWFENGVQEAVGTYIDDRKDGKWTIWWKNDRRRFTGNFDRGKETGMVQFWHENGQLAVKCTLLDGRKEGKFTCWYADGVKLATGNYKNGKKEGRWMEWGPDGKMRRAASYADGKLISEKLF